MFVFNKFKMRAEMYFKRNHNLLLSTAYLVNISISRLLSSLISALITIQYFNFLSTEGKHYDFGLFTCTQLSSISISYFSYISNTSQVLNISLLCGIDYASTVQFIWLFNAWKLCVMRLVQFSHCCQVSFYNGSTKSCSSSCDYQIKLSNLFIPSDQFKLKSMKC